jgi:hypothetical protein
MEITTNKIDAEIDFNKLVVIQMNRCNLALSQGAFQFSTAVLSFSCMLAHLRQKDEQYQKDMNELTNNHRKETDAIKNKKEASGLYQSIQMRTSVKEYEILVRLCSRHNLFPSKRGELNTDDDD